MAASRPLTSWQRAWPTLATFVLVILAIGCLYFARGILIPTAVAVLLTFVLSPVVIFLQRRGLWRTPAVLVVVVVATLLAVALGALLLSQLAQLVGELPNYQHHVAGKIEALRQPSANGSLLGNMQEFVRIVSNAATDPIGAQSPAGAEPVAEEPVAVELVDRSSDWSFVPLLGGVPPLMEVLASTGLVLVLVIYGLIFREDLRSRLLCLVGKGHLTITTKALDDAGRRISRFLLAQLILNATFGLSISIGLMLMGVPYALLWGFTAGVLRYVPFVGPWLAAFFPVGMSLLVSDGWLQPVGVVALFVVLELFNNLVIEPWAFGQSIGVSQSAIMVAVAFWAWLWGPVGLMLAAPLTVCLVVLGKYVPGLQFLDILLGDEPVFTADVNFYQRLLARDEDEAEEIIRRQSQTLTRVELFDQMLIPALVHARQDGESDQLSDADYEYVHAAVREIVQDLPEPPDSPAATDAAPDPSEEPVRPPLAILGCPARDATDATALDMLALELPTRTFSIARTTADTLVSEVLEEVESQQSAVVCIVGLPRGGMSHTRHLCKRLRQHFPQLKIVVGRWSASLTPEMREQLNSAGADYVGVTLQQTRAQLEELAQFLRPESAECTASAKLHRADGPHETISPILATPAAS